MRRLLHAAALLALLPATAGAAPAAPGDAWLAAVFDPGGGPVWRVDPETGTRSVLMHGNAEEPAWAPDGSRFVFHEWNRAGDRVTLRFARSDGRRERLAIRDSSSASFSPDGRRVIAQHCLAFCIGTAAIGGRIRAVMRCPCLIYDPAWSPNGGRFAYVRQRDYPDGGVSTTVMIRTFGGRERALVGEGAQCGEQGAPEWSPDGTRVAFVCSDEVVVARADRGSSRVVARGSTFAWSPDGRSLAVSREVDGVGTVSIVGVVTGASRTILRGDHAYSLAWRPA